VSIRAEWFSQRESGRSAEGPVERSGVVPSGGLCGVFASRKAVSAVKREKKEKFSREKYHAPGMGFGVERRV